MYLRTLGGLALEGGAGTDFTRRKSLLLLAYLTLEGERDRNHLAALFFSEAKDPLGSLRTTLRRLRQETPGALRADGDTLRAQLGCDALDLLAQLDARSPERALDVYAGPFLAGVSLRSLGGELEEWVYATREYLAARVRSALLEMAEERAGRGEFSEAGSDAERAGWLSGALEPEPEEYRRLALLLAAAQSPLLGRLRQRASAFGLDLTVGEGPAEAREALLRAAPRPQAASSGLPIRVTSFVGRAVECREVLEALARSEVQLLTLVGPGGIGKTRVALEVARTVQAERAVAFIALEAVASLETLPVTIADALGTRLPAEPSAFEALVAVLASRRTLLVLDGAEHLLYGSSALARLLLACPDLKVLLTSRESLGIEQEWVLAIGGLKVPGDATPDQEALRSEAVDLFVQRARRVRLDFDLTPDELPAALRVCRQVGGSPLGIELAAAWIRIMPVAAIAEEIARSLDFLEAAGRDRSEKHGSVRAVFDQTWGRLTGPERLMLARLSVFRGGFTREAAGRVAGATLPALATLVGKSLIRPVEHGRYDVHALLVQFMGEHLARQPAEASGALAIHGRFFLSLCEQAAAGFQGSQDERRWLERIEQDIDNIRAALTRWLAQGQIETALRAVLAIRKYWMNRGRLLREGRSWFARALSDSAAVSALTLEKALNVDGMMAMFMGSYADARQQLEASLAMTARRGGANPLALMHLGIVRAEEGDVAQARRLFEEAVSQYRLQSLVAGSADPLNGKNNLGAALNNLGNLLMQVGEFGAALSNFEEALELERKAGGGETEVILSNIGDAYVQLGQWDTARRALAQAIQGLAARGLQHGLTNILKNLVLVMIGQRRYAQAGVLLGIVDTQREVYETVMSAADQAAFEEQLAALRTTFPKADLDEAWDRGRRLTLEEGVAYAIEITGTESPPQLEPGGITEVDLV